MTTDEDGCFAVAVPGPGNYVATIDPDTIPEDVSLKDEERTELSVHRSRAGQARNVLFPLQFGEGRRRRGDYFDRFLRLGVEGIKFGLIIAICAVGLSLIFGTTGPRQLRPRRDGHVRGPGRRTSSTSRRACRCWWPRRWPSWSAVVERASPSTGLFWRPLKRRGTGLIAMLVITIGAGILVRYMFLYQFDGFTRTYDDYQLQTSGFELGPGHDRAPRPGHHPHLGRRAGAGGAVPAAHPHRQGHAGRRPTTATWPSPRASTSRRSSATCGRPGAGLAALGGILLGLSEQVSWLMGFQLLLLMFAGVTLGGLGTAYGALVGSLVVGLFVQLSTLFVAPELKNVGALLILILILLIRPQGILGQSERVG